MKRKTSSAKLGKRSKALLRTARAQVPELQEYADKLEGLRKKLQHSQPQFGRVLGVQQSVVSAWKRAKKAPSGRTIAKLARLAADAGDVDLALWFLEKFGIDRKTLRRVGAKLLQELIGKPKPGEIVRAPVLLNNSYSGSPPIAIPSEFADERLPLSYEWRKLDRRLPDSPFGAGDFIALHTSAGSNLFLLHDRLVLAEFPDFEWGSETKSRLQHPDWPSGLILGTVGITPSMLTDQEAGPEGSKILFLATLSFADSTCTIGSIEALGEESPFQPFDGCRIRGRFVGGFKKKPEGNANRWRGR